jgi:hypothetical protein
MLKNKRPEKRTESDIMVLIIAIRVLIIAITVLIIAVTREADGERYHGRSTVRQLSRLKPTASV